jgi:hypothetical protein
MKGQPCMICGAELGPNNSTGIGSGCMAHVVLPAKRDCFREVKSLDLWIAKAQYVRSIFLSTFEGRKFRNDFKKSFFSSMQQAERISKKQLEVMTNWLQYERVSLFTINDVEIPMKDKFNPEIECPELYKERLEVHRKLFLSGRKDQKAEA